MKIKQTLVFSSLLVAILTLSYFLHNSLVPEHLSEPKVLMQCYLINFVLAVFIFVVIQIVQEKQATVTGYVFLFGSLLKFIAYFVYIKPLLESTGDISKIRFFFFFIPYAIALIVEVYFLIQILNKSDEIRNKEKESQNN